MSSVVKVTNVSKKMEVYFGNLALEIAVNVVKKCAEKYEFNVEEAIAFCGLESRENLDVFTNKTKQAPKKKSATTNNNKPKTVKPKFPLPYNGEYNEECCQGLNYNHGLFTQCLSQKGESAKYCKRCSTQVEKNENGKPDCGTIQDRQNSALMDFRDPKERPPVPFVKIMRKLEISQEIVLEEAGKFNIEINSIHFVEPPPVKKGRKTPPVTQDDDEAPQEAPRTKKGRPSKKKETVVSTFTEETDLFENLTQQAATQASQVSQVSLSQAQAQEDDDEEMPGLLEEEDDADDADADANANSIFFFQEPQPGKEEEEEEEQSNESESDSSTKTVKLTPSRSFIYPATQTQESEEKAPEEEPTTDAVVAPAVVASKKVSAKKEAKPTKEEKEAQKEAEKAKKAAEKAAEKEAEKTKKAAEKAAEKEAKKLAEKEANKNKKPAKAKETTSTKKAKAEEEARQKAEEEARQQAEEKAKQKKKSQDDEEEDDEDDEDEENEDDEEQEEQEEQEPLKLQKFTYGGKKYYRDQYNTAHFKEDGEDEPKPVGKWNPTKNIIVFNKTKTSEEDEASEEESEDAYDA